MNWIDFFSRILSVRTGNVKLMAMQNMQLIKWSTSSVFFEECEIRPRNRIKTQYWSHVWIIKRRNKKCTLKKRALFDVCGNNGSICLPKNWVDCFLTITKMSWRDVDLIERFVVNLNKVCSFINFHNDPVMKGTKTASDHYQSIEKKNKKKNEEAFRS